MRASFLADQWPPVFVIAAMAAIVGGSAQFTLAANLVTYEITADDMCCGGCAKKVAAQLYTAPGVTNVKANVAARTVTVFAKPSNKLTVERLWNAVEKGKGGPSKLVSATATYTLLKPEQSASAANVADASYSVVVANLQADGVAELVSRELRGVKGVKTILVHLDSELLVIEPQPGVLLSPIAIAAAVERTTQQPLSVTGPQGRLTIETAPRQLSSRPQSQGEVR